MSDYQFEVEYRTPPVMSSGEGETVMTETVFCDEIRYPDEVGTPSSNDNNYIGPVEFIEYEVNDGGEQDSGSRNEVVKFSVKWGRFISATKK